MKTPSNITYRFGFDENNNLVDILKIEKNERSKHTFHCIACGKELIPVMGIQKISHFRHIHDSICNNETYLHKLSKLLFKYKFENTNSLYIQANHKQYCSIYNQCKIAHLRNECFTSSIVKYDLKSNYDQVFIEKHIGNFVADILLVDSTGRNPDFLIEFFVTHKCESNKLNSKFQIFEIKITSDNDIVNLFDTNTLVGELYNFTSLTETTQEPLSLEWQIEVFALYSSGKSFHRPLKKTCNNLLAPNFKTDKTILEYIVIWPLNPNIDRYTSFILTAEKLGFPIKDCRLCSFFKQSTSFYEGNKNLCILYKKLHIPKHPSVLHAYGCPKYTIDKHFIYSTFNNPIIIYSNKSAFNILELKKIFTESQKHEKGTYQNDYESKQLNRYPQRNEQDTQKRSEIIQLFSIFRDYFNKNNIIISYKDTKRPQTSIIAKLKPYYNHCEYNLENLCIILSHSTENSHEKLFIRFIPAGEPEPLLKKSEAIVIFIYLNNDLSNIAPQNDNLIIKDFDNAVFRNIEKIIEFLEIIS